MVGGLTQNSMLRFNTMDTTSQRLLFASRYTNAAGAAAGLITYNPIVKTIIGTHERDKQNEDNLTYLYEYMALLNSRLQTLITKLTNAYTTDIDTAMADTSLGGKPAMMGRTGEDLDADGKPGDPDPGAARTSQIYYGLWRSSSGTDGGIHPVNTAATISFTASAPNPPLAAGSSTGTVSFQNQGGNEAFLDCLYVDLLKNELDAAVQTRYAVASGSNELSATALDLSATEKTNSKAKNKFESVLWRAMRSREYKDIIKFGLMKDVIIAASSNLASGAQSQGTLNLSWDMDKGYIKIKSDRWSAFYHS